MADPRPAQGRRRPAPGARTTAPPDQLGSDLRVLPVVGWADEVGESSPRRWQRSSVPCRSRYRSPGRRPGPRLVTRTWTARNAASRERPRVGSPCARCRRLHVRHLERDVDRTRVVLERSVEDLAVARQVVRALGDDDVDAVAHKGVRGRGRATSGDGPRVVIGRRSLGDQLRRGRTSSSMTTERTPPSCSSAASVFAMVLLPLAMGPVMTMTTRPVWTEPTTVIPQASLHSPLDKSVLDVDTATIWFSFLHSPTPPLPLCPMRHGVASLSGSREKTPRSLSSPTRSR